MIVFQNTQNASLLFAQALIVERGGLLVAHVGRPEPSLCLHSMHNPSSVFIRRLSHMGLVGHAHLGTSQASSNASCCLPPSLSLLPNCSDREPPPPPRSPSVQLSPPRSRTERALDRWSHRSGSSAVSSASTNSFQVRPESTRDLPSLGRVRRRARRRPKMSMTVVSLCSSKCGWWCVTLDRQ